MGIKFTNNAATTLAVALLAPGTTMVVASGGGALFPVLTAADYCYCTLTNTAGAVEIIKVTVRSTDTFTIVRGQDSTTALTWAMGDKVELRLVSAGLVDILALAGGLSIVLVSTTTQAAVAGSQYVLGNAAATTVTLPASPAANDVVGVKVGNGLVTNLVNPNGSTIEGLSGNLTIDNQYANVKLQFLNGSWRLM